MTQIYISDYSWIRFALLPENQINWLFPHHTFTHCPAHIINSSSKLPLIRSFIYNTYKFTLFANMKLQVYNSEIFERGALWYILFSVFFVFFILVLLLSNNYVGVITLCFFLWGYMIFSISILEPTDLMISEKYLRIWKKTYSWSTIQWFVIEVHKDREEIKNVVLIAEWNHYIYTIKDTPENVRAFLVELNDYSPLLNWYPQTTLQLLFRKLKL